MLTWKQAIQPMLPSNNQKITKIPLKTGKKGLYHLNLPENDKNRHENQ